MSDPATARPPLTPEQLTPAIEPERLKFATTAELEGEGGQLGAERALAAMRLGIRRAHAGVQRLSRGPGGARTRGADSRAGPSRGRQSAHAPGHPLRPQLRRCRPAARAHGAGGRRSAPASGDGRPRHDVAPTHPRGPQEGGLRAREGTDHRDVRPPGQGALPALPGGGPREGRSRADGRRGAAGLHTAQGGRRAGRGPGAVRGAHRGAQEAARGRTRGGPAARPGVHQGPAGDRPQRSRRRRVRRAPLRRRIGRAPGRGDRGGPSAGGGAAPPRQGSAEPAGKSRRFPGGGAPAGAAVPFRAALAARPLRALSR